MLASGDIIEVSRLVAHLVLGPSVSMISGVIRFNPTERVRLDVSGFRSGKSGLLGTGQERWSSGGSTSSIGSVGGRQRTRVVVVETK